jgi:two-component system cell cycle response regulator
MSSMAVPRTWRLSLRLFQGLAFAGAAAYAAQALVALCGDAATDFFENYVYTGLIAAAGALCLTRGALVRRERAAWLLLGTGLAAWAAGEIYYSAFLQELTKPPLPSVSDALWLSFYPCCFVAIGLLVRERVRDFRSSLWLDGLVGALAAAGIGSALVFDGIAGSGEGTRAVAVDLSYLLGDLLLLGFVIGVFALTAWRPGRAFGLLGIGLIASAVVDAFFLHQSATGSEVSTTLMATLWPVSALLVGCAAWVQPARQPLRIDGWRVLVFPSAFALAGVGLLAYQAIEPLNPLALGFGLATLVAVIARMGLTFRENVRLLESTRREASTDALTGLGNRRQLMVELAEAMAAATPESPRALMLLDLDGFKQYNDRYGHPVGDSLLARLGRSLAEAVSPLGKAFRLGGDEFCVIASGSDAELHEIEASAKEALRERGEGFEITASCGTVVAPTEAEDVTHALNVADERLYAQKGRSRRQTVSREASHALVQVLREREPTLDGHVHGVADLAQALGLRLGLRRPEMDELTRAAELHDIGKVAVPDGILSKPGPLNPREWEFVRQHTLVGDRILSASPALTPVAKMVRATHENYDGSGYPDGISGEEIPFAARVVAVCDAFNAMTTDRPYRRAVSVSQALAELRRCAGQQFDPYVVEAFCQMVAPRAAAA